jgi:hypothetical protein
MPLILLIAGCFLFPCPDEDAEELVASYQDCVEDEDCMVVSMADVAGEDNCVRAFQCSVALNVDADLDTLAEETVDIVKSQKRCGECVQGECVPIEDLIAICNEDGLCEENQLGR